MGYRIHCSPVYQVTYGNGYFSHNTAAINSLLQSVSEDISYEGEDIEAAERLEIPRADLAHLIGKITNDREWFVEWLKRNSIDSTPEYFITVLCEWISNSDPRNDYVVLTWF